MLHFALSRKVILNQLINFFQRMDNIENFTSLHSEQRWYIYKRISNMQLRSDNLFYSLLFEDDENIMGILSAQKDIDSSLLAECV